MLGLLLGKYVDYGPCFLLHFQDSCKISESPEVTHPLKVFCCFREFPEDTKFLEIRNFAKYYILLGAWWHRRALEILIRLLF